MVMKNILLATEAGLGEGDPIFPIQIFRVKEGVNYNPGEPNYDLFQLAVRCSAKRLFPNFSFIDAPFNLQYYKPGIPRPRSPTWGAAPGSWGTSMTPTGRSATGGATCLHHHQPAPAGYQGQGDMDVFFEGVGPDAGSVCGPASGAV